MRSKKPSWPRPTRPWTTSKSDFTPDQLKQAKKALAQGETGNAEALFQKALNQSTAQAAEAAYHLGVLAESRIDYLKANEYYAKAVQLQPDNPYYLNALGGLQRTLGLYPGSPAARGTGPANQ